MGILVDSSSCREIQRILRLRGDKRLGVENAITEKILSLSEKETPGLRLKFLESREMSLEGGTWIEYFALYKMKKWVETVKYLEYVFSLRPQKFKIIISFRINAPRIIKINPII